MTVKILREGRVVECKLAEDLLTDGSFVLCDDDQNEIIVETPLNLDSAFCEKSFDIHFYSKKDIKESDIFQVYLRDSDKRIGWLIPTLALSSIDHDFADNEHFLRYAYIAVRESLKVLDEKIYSINVDGSEGRIGFSDIFHDSTAILVICNDVLGDSFPFNKHRASPSLIRYGFVQLGEINPQLIQLNRDVPAENRLYIEQVSALINNDRLISDLLNISIAFEDSPAFRFFLLYQIVELLIDEIYRIEQSSVVAELIKVQGDSRKTKDCLDKINRFMSEKHRLSLLVQEYSQSDAVFSNLKRACNLLLKNLGRSEENAFHGYFYQVRNFIFHQYRDFPKSELSSLQSIIDEFLDVLPGVLAAFEQPKGALT